MDKHDTSLTGFVPGQTIASDGDFAGWKRLLDERFNARVGPFYHRVAEACLECAFRPSAYCLNSANIVHGGALMTFADYALYIAAVAHVQSRRVVTVSMASEFIAAAGGSEMITAYPEVLSSGRSLVYVRGTLVSAGRLVMNYSGVLKRISEKDGFEA